MKVVARTIFVALAAVALASPAFCQDDVEGSKDYPGVTRMPGYFIYEYHEQAFDSFAFTVKAANSTKEQAVEGHRYDYHYNLKEGVTMPSAIQILRNYQNAARAAGGQVIYSGEDSTTLRIGRDGKEAWIAVQTSNIPSGMFITMNIIEKEAMKQHVAMNADAMMQGLSQAGEVAIYGIYFDTAKSDVKPESDPALAEIAKLLSAHPDLRVYIVGHTDMVGDAAANVKLAQARAQSVVTALSTKNGIPAARMVPFGAGPYAPVSTNWTEEGRAKNRRVELVEIATK